MMFYIANQTKRFSRQVRT